MRYLAFALLLAATSHAAIILRATCTAPTATYPYDFGSYPAGSPVPGTGGAQVIALNGFGSATASCFSSLPESGVYSPIIANAHVDAGSASASVPSPGMVSAGSASSFTGAGGAASISGEIAALTEGPVRPGLLHLSGSSFVCENHCGVGGSIFVDGNAAPSDGSSLPPIAVTLGIPFVIQIMGVRGYTACADTGGCGMQWTEVTAQWQFTELNGTAVSVVAGPAIPEPSTIFLCGCALVAGVALRRSIACR